MSFQSIKLDSSFNINHNNSMKNKNTVNSERVTYSIYNPKTHRFLNWDTGKFSLKDPERGTLYNLKDARREVKEHKNGCIVTVKTSYTIEILA